MYCNRLSPVRLGLSLGIIWGLSLLTIGLLAIFSGYGHSFITTIGTMYLGYAPTVLGSLIGCVIGFADAFISGFLIAWLYNFIGRCRSKGCDCGCSCCDKEDSVSDINVQ